MQVSNTNWADTHIDVYLSNEYTTTVDSLGNTLVGGFKCALALNIIFAAVGGRAGPLEGVLIVIIGTIFYELNRQILTLFSVDHGGSMTIFEFGGVAGSIVSILLTLTTQKNIIGFNSYYTSKKHVATITMIGTTFIWLFLPVLNTDIPSSLFIYSNAGISTLYSTCACLATVMGITLTLEGKLSYRDMITAPIAGGIIIGSSASYIYNPLESFMLGILAAIVQILFNRLEQKKSGKPLWCNGVLSLFAVQGFLGGLFSAVMRAIHRTVQGYDTAYYSLPSKFVYDQGGQITGTFVTLGIAIATGIILYIVISAVNQEKEENLYKDRAYWLTDHDGISVIKPQSDNDDKMTEPREDMDVDVSEGKGHKDEAAYL